MYMCLVYFHSGRCTFPPGQFDTLSTTRMQGTNDNVHVRASVLAVCRPNAAIANKSAKNTATWCQHARLTAITANAQSELCFNIFSLGTRELVVVSST